MKPLEHFRWTIWNTVKAGACLHLLQQYFYTIRPTAGPSMLPTLHVSGDAVLQSKLHTRGHGIQVGDVISFRMPLFPGISGIKRVVGMPGDFVLRDTPGSGSDTMIQVPEGHCWVVGDDMSSSRDSRTFGPIPLALINGKVLLRIRTHGNPYVEIIRNGLQRPEE